MRDDLKAAIRALRKSPTVTAVALVVLALGATAGNVMSMVLRRAALLMIAGSPAAARPPGC